MFKTLGLLFLVMAVGQAQNLTIYQNTHIARTDDYIKLNRQQYAQTVQNCDARLDKFREHYTGRTDGINLQLQMVVDSLVQAEERLNPLELLSDFNKACVTKYRSVIPTVANTKTSITSCVNVANNQINSLLTNSINTKNTLQNYYTNYFEKEITNCAKKFDNSTQNYTSCVSTVIVTTNSYTISNQKNFDIYMDSADCSANANIKRALDCSYVIQFNTITLIAEVNTLINKCLAGEDNCDKCNQGFTCQNALYLESKDVNYKNETMRNPFYGNDYLKDCLMLVVP